MPWRPLVLLLLVLASVPPTSAQGASERDRAAEVREGASVHAYVEFHVKTQTHYAGTDGYYSVAFDGGYELAWSGTLELNRAGPGKVAGSVFGEWNVTASKGREWDAQDENSHYSHDTACNGRDSGPFSANVEATPEAEGLRVTVHGYAVPNFSIPEACRTETVDIRLGETQRGSHTSAFGSNVGVLPLEGDDYDARVTFLVPYDGSAAHPFRFRTSIPHGHEGPAKAFCLGEDSYAWAPGTCDATGTLTVRNLVDPCPYLRKTHPDRHAALASVASPVGLDEAGVRAWAKEAQRLVQQVLGDHRSWQLLGCAGDLQPDPWDAVIRTQQLQRDALLKLLREGKLSQEGIHELLGAERSLQLLGDESSSTTLAEIEAAATPPKGQIEVRVHSPVSIHLYDADGGHVGWDAAGEAGETTIAGASYEGAPGGAQTIRAPAGFYKLVVDELEAGGYLLEVLTNGTAADAVDWSIVQSRGGRTTSTHYALIEGWEGPRLEAYPVRRGPTDGAAVMFLDEGRPPTRVLALPGDAEGYDGSGDGGVRDAAGTPAPGALLVLIALAGAAVGRRARGKLE